MIRRRSASFVLAAVVLFPLIPWLLAGPVSDRFHGSAILHSVANLAAFFAISAWAAALVLASRIRPVERAFGGLEHLYVVHRRLAVLVVVLATTHVLFLTLHASHDALDLYLPSAGWQTFSGIVAIVLLDTLLVLTLLNRLSYQRFIAVQRLLGAAFAVGAVHAIAIRGTAAHSPALTVYLVVLTTAGVAGFAYRTIGSRLGAGRHRLVVKQVHHLAGQTIEIVMSPVGAPPTFEPGQFFYATFHQDGIGAESHPFTIASAPGDELRIAVKRLGDFTGRLMQLRAGARVELEGPFGTFLFSPEDDLPQTCIAGGIGITPFLSWARNLTGPIPIDLYYCTPGADEAHFIDELYDIADRHRPLRVIPVRRATLGHLTVEDFEAVNPKVMDGRIYICGPQHMIDKLRAEFEGRGMSPDRIRSENFDFR